MSKCVARIILFVACLHLQPTEAFVGTLPLASSSLSTGQQRQRRKKIVPILSTPHDDTNNNSQQQQQRRLVNVVCLVTGASRGIGKGVAVALGKEGATVYITGTSSSSSSASSASASSSSSSSSASSASASSTNKYSTNDVVGGPETLEEAAQAITKAGGIGIPMVCNHADDSQVKAVFACIEQQHGRLDILVNNVFRVPPQSDGLFGKFYELPIETWDTIMDIGLRSHYVASVYAIPLLLKSKEAMAAARRNPTSSSASSTLPRPLIAMISSFGGLTYTFNVPYGVGKAGVDRMVKDMAIELQADDICVTSFWPGLVRTERTDRMVESGAWDQNVGIPLDPRCTETPEFTGRAIVEVALDDDNNNNNNNNNNQVSSLHGTTQVVAELATKYKFTDVNGNTPPSIRSLRFLLPVYGMDSETRSKLPIHLIPDWKVPFWIMANGRPPSIKKRT